MEHCQLIRVFVGNGVDYIKAEIEGLAVREGYRLEPSLLVLDRLNKLFAYQLFDRSC